ncbi:MAG: DUF4124 domain-containing protein [Betaproteobacteria bacterium]|nr:DUF4124 domain-containing protein [Betaproteobacteria bacterium]
MKKYLFLSLFALTLSNFAFAEIYKHIDADGRVTYSNIKSKGAVQLELDPDVHTISNKRVRASERNGANKRTSIPEDFPRVDRNTQSQRDEKRRDILFNELTAEKATLEQAKRAYTEGEANPEVYKTVDGKTFRNVPKFEEKMKNLQAEVDSHQKNIGLLQKELDSLK